MGVQILKALVIVMGVAILVGIGLLIYGLARTSPSGPGTQVGDVSVPVPSGCAIAEATMEGDRLVLRLDGLAERGCQQIIFVRLDTGEVAGRVTVTPEP